MRSAEVNGYWKNVYKDSRRYCNYIKEVSFLDDKDNVFSIELSPGITAICGLNGAGKSSFIASIKELLGLSAPSIISKKKIKNQVSAKIIIERTSCDITIDNNAASCGLLPELCKYIDSDLAIAALKYWDQQNIEELLDGIEGNHFSPDQIKTISGLVGKNYTECISYEIDELVEEGEEDRRQSYMPVFFKVKNESIEYDSRGMGIGEHFILYVFYILEAIKENSILIIEEPESYISVLSQQRLADYIAKIISEKKISVIITTHSPHILKRISADHVRIISNRAGRIEMLIPRDIKEAKQHLGIEYYKTESNIATLFVEDNIARIFVNSILKEEDPLLENSVDIVYAGGHANITARLMFDDREYMSHRFVGIYDDDVKEKEDFKSDDLKWPYLFLPVKDCVEKEIQLFLSKKCNEEKLCNKLGVSTSTFSFVLSKREGEDHHDWFMNICKDLDIKYEVFVDAFYGIWKETHMEIISSFVSNLTEYLLDEGKKTKLVEMQYACVV
jgi:predicted ATPase